MKDETPCRYCRNHSPTCHSECKLYLDWRERHLEKKKKVQKARNLQRMMDEREKDALNRMIYNRHR